MMDQFPTLITERLTLGEVRLTDIPAIVTQADSELISRTTLNLPHPYGENDAIKWINLARQGFVNQNHFIFGIRLRSTDEFMGGIGLVVSRPNNKAEIGYWIGTPFWGKGYMTEATAAIIRFGFEELSLNRIFASYISDNVASGRVMEKCGMIKEGEFADNIRKNGEYKSTVHYRLTRAEFDATKESQYP